jgi:hypothetical protein
MPMLSNMSATKRNDVALIGIVLLASGIAVLAVQGAALAERLVMAGGLWTAALATFVAARRP